MDRDLLHNRSIITIAVNWLNCIYRVLILTLRSSSNKNLHSTWLVKLERSLRFTCVMSAVTRKAKAAYCMQQSGTTVHAWKTIFIKRMIVVAFCHIYHSFPPWGSRNASWSSSYGAIKHAITTRETDNQDNHGSEDEWNAPMATNKPIIPYSMGTCQGTFVPLCSPSAAFFYIHCTY